METERNRVMRDELEKEEGEIKGRRKRERKGRGLPRKKITCKVDTYDMI